MPTFSRRFWMHHLVFNLLLKLRIIVNFMLKKSLCTDTSVFLTINVLKNKVVIGGERWLKVGYCGKLNVLNCRIDW